MSNEKSNKRKPSRPPFVVVVLAIFPPPARASDEFTLIATSATEGYSADTPIVVGQYSLYEGQALTVLMRVRPDPPPPVLPVPPRFADGWPEEAPAFARELRQARGELGLSQARLAALAGYSELTIRNIETNRHQVSAESRRWIILAVAKARQEIPGKVPSRDPREDSR